MCIWRLVAYKTIVFKSEAYSLWKTCLLCIHSVWWDEFKPLLDVIPTVTHILQTTFNFKVLHYLEASKDSEFLWYKLVCFSLHVQAKIFADSFKACFCCKVARKTEAVKSEVAEYRRDESAGSMGGWFFFLKATLTYSI